MKKSVKCTVLCLIMVCCMVFSLPLTASAATREYSFNFSEPPVGEGQGYVLVEYVNTSTNKYYLNCFFWNSILVGSSNINALEDSGMFITIQDDTISFAPLYQSEFSFGAVFSYFMSFDNSLNRYFYRDVSAPMQTIYSYSFGSSYDIVSFKCVGDFISVETDITNRDTFNVAWGETKLLLEDISVLIQLMYDSLENDEEALETFKQILTNTNDIETLLTDILYWVKSCNDKLQVIKLRVEDIEDLLEEFVNAKGESTFEEPSTESISDYNKAEDELVSGADDTSDIEQQIEDFEIDANASGKIWDIITQFFNCHPKIMGLVIGILCLGIIALILNR